jgi:hypothetical protein
MKPKNRNNQTHRRCSMVSTEEFWTRVGTYNEATWPVLIAMIAAAAFLTYRVFLRPGARTDLWLKAFLAFAFAWNGIVFFLVYMKNPVSMFTGAPLFILVALLFALDIRAKRTRFQPPATTWKKGLTLFWIVLAFLHPVIGWPLGHIYPQTLLPVLPCPLTVFAIALVAGAAPNVDKKVFVLLLPWALLALPKCFGALNCYEDCILFASGVYGVVELVRMWKARPAVGREELVVQREVTG